MIANCQIQKKHCLRDQSFLTQKIWSGEISQKKETNPEAVPSNFSRDLIEELTIKNSLLVAQLSEYRILRLSERQQTSSELAPPNEVFKEKQTVKLGTIEQEFSTMSEITYHSERKAADAVIDCYFNELSKLLSSYSIMLEEESWDSYLMAVREVLAQRRTLNSFVKRVDQMKQQIEPGISTIQELWEWLKKLGHNYSCLRQYEHSKNKGLSIPSDLYI